MSTLALKTLREDEHISVSSLTTYLKCPRQHQHRYQLLTPPAHRSGALAFGSAIHAALATFYRAHLEGKEEPTVETLGEVFTNAWQHELASETPVLLDEKETAEGLAEKGREMLKVFHQEAERPHRVVAVEEPFSVELYDPTTGETLPARLLGVFDAVVETKDGTYRILEHKTAARKWTDDRLAHDLQVTAYSFAASLLGLGEPQVAIQLLAKTKTPAYSVYLPTRSIGDHLDFLQVAAGVLKAIKADAYFPKRDWWCKSCPFAGPCLAG